MGVPYLITPNSSGVASLGELAGPGQQYLGTCRADGTIVLTPVVKTPYVGETGEAAVNTPAPKGVQTSNT